MEEGTSGLGLKRWAVCQAEPWGQGVAGKGNGMLRGTEALPV